MCGVVGFFGGDVSRSTLDQESLLKRMANTIVHRGPDDVGYWVDQNQHIGLGHRRLSIVDLSPAGHQPMHSVSGRFVIAFNGEIYNHLLLRKILESSGQAPIWCGHSDTETLLAGFDVWGIKNTVERAVGMFAFAVWDRQACSLTLVRDRMGEKPLYYGWQGDSFLFGSELKALRAHPAFRGQINRGALSLFLRHNTIPAPYSIYQGIEKLPAGGLLAVSLQQREPKITMYWSGGQVVKEGINNIFTGNANQAIDELEILLKDAVRQQMAADVPLGAFLSGGIDSSTIVALMQAQSSQPVKTFTIGFNEEGYDEAKYAKAVAAHLGTDHTELYVTPEQAMNVIPRLPFLYDEPFADSSQIPTFLVSQLAKQRVTVSLSGDAGDELFCGYNRYIFMQHMWGRVSVLPYFLRHVVATGFSRVSPRTWNRVLRPFMRLAPQRLQHGNVGDKLHKLAGILGANSPDAFYRSLVSHWLDPAAVVLEGDEPPTLLDTAVSELNGLSAIERMMALDMLTYLPDDILVKLDRAAMGVSLETRVPFLDHRVIEFAWLLPQSLKLREGQSKWILRQILFKYIPKTLIERPKMGFGVPIDTWLRGPLREWAEELLDESRLKAEGYFNPTLIRLKWQEHISGQRNWQYHLWDVLVFQSWLESQV